MAKKSKSSKPSKRAKQAKNFKNLKGPEKPKPFEKPKILTRGKAVKSESEFQALHTLGTTAKTASVPVVACWFSDSGGADKCVELPEDVCKSRGGVPDEPPCPNC